MNSFNCEVENPHLIMQRTNYKEKSTSDIYHQVLLLLNGQGQSLEALEETQHRQPPALWSPCQVRHSFSLLPAVEDWACSSPSLSDIEWPPGTRLCSGTLPISKCMVLHPCSLTKLISVMTPAIKLPWKLPYNRRVHTHVISCKGLDNLYMHLF